MSSEVVSSEEYKLLKNIAGAASDVVLGNLDREFASKNGGKDSLHDIMTAQVSRYHDWLGEQIEGI